jgi:diketogulonate reductase-like aldo/keto reductase
MQYKKLASGFRMPVLGIGTWRVGGDTAASHTRDKEEVAAMKAALKLGYDHIDTAEYYGAGHAEELVGEAIAGFDRKKLFITSKVMGDHLKYDEVINACKQSLKRLGTDYVDLYLVHWPNPRTPLKETMSAMDWLVEQKLVKNIGVSNFSVAQMKEAQRHSRNKVVANQMEYNLLVRNKGLFTTDMESEVIPYCQKNDVMFIAWRPVAMGDLTKPGIRLLDEIAAKYGKTQAQVAINWLISKKNVVTIVKATNAKHLKENLGALGWTLKTEDVVRLDTELPGGLKISKHYRET